MAASWIKDHFHGQYVIEGSRRESLGFQIEMEAQPVARIGSQGHDRSFQGTRDLFSDAVGSGGVIPKPRAVVCGTRLGGRYMPGEGALDRALSHQAQ